MLFVGWKMSHMEWSFDSMNNFSLSNLGIFCCSVLLGMYLSTIVVNKSLMLSDISCGSVKIVFRTLTLDGSCLLFFGASSLMHCLDKVIKVKD